MTEKQAIALAKRALPCPFCGERLQVRDDHHGHYLEHRGLGNCIFGVVELLGEADLAEWNMRYTEPKPRTP